MRGFSFVLMLVGLLGAMIGCGAHPTSPTPTPQGPPPTSRIVFMTIPVINIGPNKKGAYPAVPSRLSTGIVEVVVDTVPPPGVLAVYVFKLPPLNTPEYTAMRERWTRCVFYAEFVGACEGAAVSDLSYEAHKVLKLEQTTDEVMAGFSYHSVFWNRGDKEVSVQGEYAFTPR